MELLESINDQILKLSNKISEENDFHKREGFMTNIDHLLKIRETLIKQKQLVEVHSKTEENTNKGDEILSYKNDEKKILNQ